VWSIVHPFLDGYFLAIATSSRPGAGAGAGARAEASFAQKSLQAATCKALPLVLHHPRRLLETAYCPLADAKGGRENVVVEGKKSLRERQGAGILARERSNEADWRAAEVLLVVEERLGEDGCHARGNGSLNCSAAILFCDSDANLVATLHVENLSPSGVNMGRIDGARCEVELNQRNASSVENRRSVYERRTKLHSRTTTRLQACNIDEEIPWAEPLASRKCVQSWSLSCRRCDGTD